MSPFAGCVIGPPASEPRSVRSDRRAGAMNLQALGLELLSEQEGELKSLAGVEARIALRLVALVQVLDGDVGRATDALGDLLAGHLEMHAARMRSLGAVHGEEVLHLAQNVVEVAGLAAVRCGNGVAVHRIARPHD